MKFSENISNISAAFSQFQAEVPTIGRDSVNPHFKSTYASLDEILDTIRPYLAKNGLAVMLNPVKSENGDVGSFAIVTHSSGEYYIFDPVYIPLKQPTPHQVGSAIQYSKRYAIVAALGLSTGEPDTDGNDIEPTREKAIKQTQPASKPQESKSNGLAPWEQLAKVGRIQQRRFFAQCKELTDKQQKAIIFYYTGKISRSEVTEEEYQRINDDIQMCNETDIQMMICTAVEKKLAASG